MFKQIEKMGTTPIKAPAKEKSGNSKADTRKLLERKWEELKNFKGELQYGPIGKDPDNHLTAIGPSIVKTIVDICELAFNLFCWEYASPEGTEKFPSLKDLGNLNKECVVPVPVVARTAAKGLLDMKEICFKKTFFDHRLIIDVAELAMSFLDYLGDWGRSSRDEIHFTKGKVEDIYNLLDCYLEKLEVYKRKEQEL
ncbi:MAG: hypothetical protein IKF90_08900 [Parasporobacterium sp.]|nr:hypothetical protein [Parasporobacterium sp.]